MSTVRKERRDFFVAEDGSTFELFAIILHGWVGGWRIMKNGEKVESIGGVRISEIGDCRKVEGVWLNLKNSLIKSE